MKFSVLLLIPDYAADNFGQDTVFDHFEAVDAAQAVRAAQAWTYSGIGNAFPESAPEDFHCLLVLYGWHDDVSP